MNKITIIRHGKPEAHHRYSKLRIVKGSDIVEFVNDWNTCELSKDNKIPEQLKLQIAGADYFSNKQTEKSY